jgi:hypothetical protein
VRARDILWGRGVEALQCLEPGASSGVGRRNPGPGQPDAFIRWKDWQWMREHLSSGWKIPEDPVKKKTIPVTRCHLQAHTQDCQKLYLNVHKDPRLQRSASADHNCHSFYQIFVRTDQDKVSHFVTDGVNKIPDEDPFARSPLPGTDLTCC